MNFYDLTLWRLRKEMRRRRLKLGVKGREEMICELQRECRSQRRIQWRMGGESRPQEQESPDISEAEEAYSEDIPLEDDGREAGSDASREARTHTTRRRPRITKPKDTLQDKRKLGWF